MLMKPKNLNDNFIKYIEENLKNELSVEAIAEHFMYSKFHFSRMFKKQMGISVMDYVCKRRLAASSEEILKGKRIIDVALSYGWQSHSSYTKSFKHEFGFSPSLLKALRMELNEFGGYAMKKVYLEATAIYETKENLIKILKETIINNKIQLDTSLEQVIQCSENVYYGIKRYSKEEYITHPLNVAIILAQLEADINTIEAGLFCDAAKKSEKFTFELLENFPDKMQLLVKEISEFSLSDLENLSDEALLVKTAERLHNMRTIEFMNDEKKKIKAKETVNVFMPVARRLKNEKLMAELNKLSIRYL